MNRHRPILLLAAAILGVLACLYFAHFPAL